MQLDARTRRPAPDKVRDRAEGPAREKKPASADKLDRILERLERLETRLNRLERGRSDLDKRGQ
jgi:hypothetical protein